MNLDKSTVALRQLNAAIKLFLDGDYVSSLTLAGAAEEILGILCERGKLPVAMENIVNHHWNETDSTLPESKRRAVLVGIMNSRRNSLKHANHPNDLDFADEPDSALQMLMRVMPMARSLDLPIIRESTMVSWANKFIESELPQ